MNKVILPGRVIGIIGGGQLGRMMAIKAKEMGYKIAVLDPTPESPAAQIADYSIVASYNDLKAIKQLAQVSDVITYEFENIDYEALTFLETNAYLPQKSHLLKISQHRYLEKKTIKELGIAVAPFALIHSQKDLLEQITYPSVLKTTTGGYDGKGQIVLKSEEQLAKALDLINKHECILEGFVPFTKEISVIVTRSVNGEKSILPVAENIHQDNILHQSIVPARISVELEQKAIEIGLEIAQKLDLVGTLAIEMFVCEEEIYVNELAPRPHNSGHFSMDACLTGQFEQHIRAICGLPLGSTKLEKEVLMVNILGQHTEDLSKYLPLLSFSKLHLYGKAEAKKQRKMGHINILTDLSTALEAVSKTGIWT
ncbi:MAG: 5-(carboxyamino)imidazole ribonucleotide synthase [Streptococcaceae bacterium]|jgi:5-(carboxyamino)imidazole ribonucleotide synthase|nr:5-(carboxyamino)imidazole ribonucleotide synthase [Streptococcaceae bacterium]